MPTYEMPVLLRIAKKTQYINTLKSVASSIFETGGFIRKIENWGDKELPCKAIAHGKSHTRAAHFMFCFDSPPSYITQIEDDCRRNLDIIRISVFKKNEPCKDVQCTFAEEMLPPPYRPSVLKMLKVGKKEKRNKDKFIYKTETMNYYPFTR